MKPFATEASAMPFLRWAGSKRKVLPLLMEFVPQQFSRYLEPFAGSACLFFRLAPRKAFLNDLNSELIDTYRTVRARPEDVGSTLSAMPVCRDSYYRVRSTNLALMSRVERAATFIYLNRFCFNGLYRTNTKGQFNVPFGAPKNHHVPTAEELRRCAGLLRRATIASEDFEKFVRTHVRVDDFVYLDPPFFRRDQRVFREYNAQPFQASDLKRLAALLEFIDDTGAKFVVSYASCPEAREAFRAWRCNEIHTMRNISGFARHRGVAKEIVVTNPGPSPRRRRMTLRR